VLLFDVSRRPSRRPYNVEYYRRNRGLEVQRVRVRQAGMVEFLRDLRRVPCADCGGRFKPYQMDFDHRDPATKSFNVMAGRAMLMATGRVLAEVAKCDIVCANCHQIRTQEARGRKPVRLSGHPGTWSKRADVGVAKPRCSSGCATCHAWTVAGASQPARWSSITAIHG